MYRLQVLICGQKKWLAILVSYLIFLSLVQKMLLLIVGGIHQYNE